MKMSDCKHANIVTTLVSSVGRGIFILCIAYLMQYYFPTIPKCKVFHWYNIYYVG